MYSINLPVLKLRLNIVNLIWDFPQMLNTKLYIFSKGITRTVETSPGRCQNNSFFFRRKTIRQLVLDYATQFKLISAFLIKKLKSRIGESNTRYQGFSSTISNNAIL